MQKIKGSVKYSREEEGKTMNMTACNVFILCRSGKMCLL